MEQDLSCEIEFYGYQGQINVNQHTLDQIQWISQMYDILLHMNPDDAAKIRAQKADILAQTLNLGASTYKDIHALAVGNSLASTQGAIKGLSLMLKKCGKYINADKSAAIQRQYAFLALNQVQACQAAINYYTGQPVPLTEDADVIAKECAGYVKELQDLAIPNTLPANNNSCGRLPPKTCGLYDQVVDSDTNLIWWVGPWVELDFYSNMYAALPDWRWKAPTCSDVVTFMQGVAGEPDPDVYVRQTPYLIINGHNYGIIPSRDPEPFMEILWDAGWQDQQDSFTGMNPSINGYAATSRHSVGGNGSCGPTGSDIRPRILLVRDLDPGERYNW
jgi:hypothetical protein